MYHHRELTYSVTAPVATWGSLRATYHRINRALAAGLRAVDVLAICASDGDGCRAPPPDPRACFRDPLPGEVIVEGRKLIGSAQWRNEGALLQHGSLLLVDEQHLVQSLRRRQVAPDAPERTMAGGDSVVSGAISLATLLDELPAVSTLTTALAAAFEHEFARRVEPDELSAEESAEAAELEDRFADPAWTWRR